MGGFEKEEEVETMWEWMSRSLKKIFVDNIPVEDVKVYFLWHGYILCLILI